MPPIPITSTLSSFYRSCYSPVPSFFGCILAFYWYSFHSSGKVVSLLGRGFPYSWGFLCITGIASKDLLCCHFSEYQSQSPWTCPSSFPPSPTHEPLPESFTFTSSFLWESPSPSCSFLLLDSRSLMWLCWIWWGRLEVFVVWRRSCGGLESYSLGREWTTTNFGLCCLAYQIFLWAE